MPASIPDKLGQGNSGPRPGHTYARRVQEKRGHRHTDSDFCSDIYDMSERNSTLRMAMMAVIREVRRWLLHSASHALGVGIALGAVVLLSAMAINLGGLDRPNEPRTWSGLTPTAVRLDSSATITPDPLGWVEYDAGRVSTIAEVRVAEIYPARAITDSGIIPTRDPNVPFYHDTPTLAKTLYAPIRVEVLEYYKGEEPEVQEILVPHYAGTAADMENDMFAGANDIPLSEIHVGDEAMLFMVPIAVDASGPDRVYIRSEAERLSTGGVHVGAFEVLIWYQYFDGSAGSWQRPRYILSIEELRAKLRACASGGCEPAQGP
jgi:hypothetical protein